MQHQIGSDVAREAADIVLMDNNFTSLTKGIEQGRLVFENLKKVILYLLPAGSWSELMPILANILLGVPLPLSSFLMIYICVITDVGPSLSLVYEKAEADLMQRPPRNKKKDPMVNIKLLLHAYGFIGMMETFSAFFIWFYYMNAYGGFGPGDLILAFNNWQDGYMGYSIDQLNEFLFTGQSVFFVSLVIVQFGNLMSTRTRHLSFFQHLPWKSKTRNMRLYVAMLASLVLAGIAIYLPFFNNVFQTTAIPTECWFMPIPFAIWIFLSEELRKYLVRRFPNSIIAKLAW